MINALFYHGFFKWIRKKENNYLTFITNKFSLTILIKKNAFVPVKIDAVFELRFVYSDLESKTLTEIVLFFLADKKLKKKIILPSLCGSQELKTKRIFYIQIKSVLLSKNN